MQFMPSNPESPRCDQRTHDASSTTLSGIQSLRKHLRLARMAMHASRTLPTVPTTNVLTGLPVIPYILLIDPDVATLDLIGLVLGKQGFRVTGSSTLPAVDCIVRLAPDIIVLAADLDRAAAAIGQLQAELKRSTLRNTPIVYATSSEETVSHVNDSFVTLHKPFVPDALLNVIDTLMVRKMSRESSTAERADRRLPLGHQDLSLISKESMDAPVALDRGMYAPSPPGQSMEAEEFHF